MSTKNNLFLFLVFVFICHAKAWYRDIKNGFAQADVQMKSLEAEISTLTRQVMSQQFYNEQRVKTEGQSGIKQVRQRRSGYKNYYVETHNGHSAAAIHDHSNNIRTVGLGEFTAVLNGVEFSTRHNDYRLMMPHQSSGEYHKAQVVPFPEVPEEVTSKYRLSDQVKEMREWFKAFQNEDDSVRDYKKYFKPVLCYLEGGWTKSKQDIEEPFLSDRHFIDAKTWIGLSDKIRYTSYSGSKSLHENLSFLPTKIIDIVNNRPVYAQWNYRILCHPLKNYLSKKSLNLVDDLSSRMMNGYNIYRHSLSRAARFQVKGENEERPVIGKTLLDELMEQIPGKDNYQGKLFDEGLDAEALDEKANKKDASKYHRLYNIRKTDAMGTSKIHRGFSDNYMYAAMTSQDKIAGMNVTLCNREKQCRNVFQKWTYAIPLEIIYLTPLSKWNPYRLEFHGDHVKNNPATKDGRYGSCNPELNRELDGINTKRFYQTPDEFFTDFTEKTKADTTRKFACVLNKHGESKKVRAAGTYVLLPNIQDVGILRQRYPIFPVHGEGSSVWKELNALKDIVMDLKGWDKMLWNDQAFTVKTTANVIQLTMSPAISELTELHTHDMEISKNELINMKGGKEIKKTTTLVNGHQHELRIRWDNNDRNIYYYRCDGNYRCWDKHDKSIQFKEDITDVDVVDTKKDNVKINETISQLRLKEKCADLMKNQPNFVHDNHHDYDMHDVYDEGYYVRPRGDHNGSIEIKSEKEKDISSGAMLYASPFVILLLSFIAI